MDPILTWRTSFKSPLETQDTAQCEHCFLIFKRIVDLDFRVCEENIVYVVDADII